MYNLGGEMVYILSSRLKAQKIDADKSIKVIREVVSALFHNRLMQEFKKPNIVAKHERVRQTFECIVHSSIMKLNASSMSKLFELMLMTFKFQIVRTRYPEEIYKLTLNHLESIREILITLDMKGNKNIIETVDNVIKDFKSEYGRLLTYDFIILKSTLLRFLQGKNIKVSIFLEQKLQGHNGVLYLPMDEKAPPLVGKPGVITVYNNGNGNEEKTMFHELKLSNLFIENTFKGRMSNFETQLGLNIFDEKRNVKYKGKITPDDNSSPPAPVANQTITNATTTLSTQSTVDQEIEKEKEKKETVVKKEKIQEGYTRSLQRLDEFKELSRLLTISSKENVETFQLDLFGSTIKTIGGENNNQEYGDDYIDIAIEDSQIKQKYENTFNDIKTEMKNKDNNEENNDEDGDDLLALMDMAASRDK